MLTLKKIGLYRKYGGDIDAWTRFGTPNEHSLMTDTDWYRIGELVQMLTLVKSGKASPNYARTIRAEARQAVESEDVLHELDSLA